MRQCERILLALKAGFEALDGPKVDRNRAIPEHVSAAGDLILWDGTGDLDEYVIGASTPYLWSWTASLQVLVEDETEADRDGKFDALCQQIGGVIAADRTLGGLCDWIDAAPPSVMERAVAGAPGLKGGEIQITFYYASANPTG